MRQQLTILMMKFTAMISINHKKKIKLKNLKVHRVTDRADKVISKQTEGDFSFMMIMMLKTMRIQHKNLTIFSINFKSLQREFKIV